MKGIDYAFTPHPGVAAVRGAGYGFACRYMSPDSANDTNGKNLLVGELHELLTAGISVVVVEESTSGRMRSGQPAGVTDGQHAQAVTTALGMPAIPVYFACDFDASPADQAAINAYLDGAASVIGRARTGIYGGYYPLKRALDAGKASWAWQTAAWSGGQWDPRAHIRQEGTVLVGGVQADADEAMTADFGQWPRPVSGSAAKPAAAAAPAAQTAPAKDASMIILHCTVNGQSLTYTYDGTTVNHIVGEADQAALGAVLPMATVTQAQLEKFAGGTIPSM